MVETIGFPVTANQSSAGDYLPIDSDTLAGCTVTNSSAYAVEYSTGGAWTTIAASGSATINTGAIATTSLRFRKKTGDSIPVVLSVAVTHPGTTPAQLATDAAGVVGVVDPSTSAILSLAEKNRYYHFHGAASVQCADDPVFFDLSGTNNGVFGTNLAVASAWANTGYISTVDPVGGSTDSVIRIPSLNYDYDGGEKLIVWWLGKCTAEGSDVTFMGDSYGTAVPGVRVRARSTGKIDVVCYGGGVGRYSPASTSAVFDGNLRDFAFVIDGAAQKYGVWVDGVFDAAFGGSLVNMGAGSADTRTSNTWQIGAGSAAPGGTDGIATRTRGLVIIRLPASRALPTVGDLTTIFKQLRANPSALILAGAV